MFSRLKRFAFSLLSRKIHTKETYLPETPLKAQEIIPGQQDPRTPQRPPIMAVDSRSTANNNRDRESQISHSPVTESRAYWNSPIFDSANVSSLAYDADDESEELLWESPAPYRTFLDNTPFATVATQPPRAVFDHAAQPSRLVNKGTTAKDILGWIQTQPISELSRSLSGISTVDSSPSPLATAPSRALTSSTFYHSCRERTEEGDFPFKSGNSCGMPTPSTLESKWESSAWTESDSSDWVTTDFHSSEDCSTCYDARDEYDSDYTSSQYRRSGTCLSEEDFSVYRGATTSTNTTPLAPERSLEITERALDTQLQDTIVRLLSTCSKADQVTMLNYIRRGLGVAGVTGEEDDGAQCRPADRLDSKMPEAPVIRAPRPHRLINFGSGGFNI